MNPTSAPPRDEPRRSRASKILRALFGLVLLYLTLSAAMAWSLLHPPRYRPSAESPSEVRDAWLGAGGTGEVRSVRIPPLSPTGPLAQGQVASNAAGPTLGASYLPARDAAPSVGGACLLLHGRGGHRGNMHPLARLLARRTPWAILALDQRASGTSDDAPSTAGIAEADDVRAALEFLRTEGVPPERVVAIGISQGAVAALLASEEAPLAGLALLAPYDDLGAAIDRRLRHYAGVPRVPLGLPMCQFGEWFAGRALFDVDLIGVAERSGAHRCAVWSRTDDWRAPLAGAERIAHALGAELFAHGGSDHWLLSGPGSDRILDEVVAFASRSLGTD